ncbi:MAG: amidohydrolase family protein [Saprospiraceae bacterium]|nr:amidohydrolase family protein [Saprospiraceae bacterium]
MEKVEKNPEKEAFDVKKEQSIKEYLSQAALFEKQGILFGFSFLNVKPSDIKNNIRTLIENGLSEDAALAALTTNPAQILGINNVSGTVEKGKIANLIITDKPYFNEKSAVKYTFVDGRKYEYQGKKKQENKPTEAGKFIGT